MTDNIVARWQRILHALPTHTKLIAVSKYTSDDNVQTLAQAGQQDFAEARPQQLRDRAQQYPDLHWHMIGPLQKNKAKYIGKYASMWHSCCDLDVASQVAKYVARPPLPTLVQVNISGEPQKQGIHPDALPLFFEKLSLIKELSVIGLMGMAAKDGDVNQAFSQLQQCRAQLLPMYPKAQELCMGMSNDWQQAIMHGATMIRVGSEIFGAKQG
jgi:pyridoxal phosphate enzyme (YggS family)